NSYQEVFSWNPSTDMFLENLQESHLLKKMASSLDIPVERLLDELEYRKRVLAHMVEHGIRDYLSVNKVLSKYYNNPELFQREFLEKGGW
ncbi:MAG: hypothetical protein QXD34_06225, partial [Candidatus Bathyarchaeia archaeon]